MPHFERRIYLGIIVMVACFVPIVLGSFFALQKIVAAEKQLLSNNARQSVLAERLRYIGSSQLAMMPVFVLTGDSKLIQAFDERNLEFQKLDTQILESEKEPYSQALIERIEELSQRLYLSAGPGIELRRRGGSSAQVNNYFGNVSGPIAQELIKLLDQLSFKESINLQQARVHVESTVNWVIAGFTFFLCVALVLSAFVGRLIVKVMRQRRDQDLAREALLNQERRVSQARKEVVEVVSHDLKSPLGTIKMSLEMILDQLSSPTLESDLDEGLRIAYRSAESMETLIKDLLDHSKIEAGQLMLNLAEFDVSLLARELTRRFQLHASKKNQKINTRIESGLPALSCDVGRVEQVLSNLIGNAIKFTPVNGAITLTLERTKDSFHFTVQDTGPGIQKEQLPYVFDRFWQVRESARQGTGLGLAIAKAIIEAHHGQIWVESIYGTGSTFHFAIPISHAVYVQASATLPLFQNPKLDLV